MPIFLHGKVVDMFYFPIVRNAHFPAWVPFWGGNDLGVFPSSIQIADVATSVGVMIILVFQNKFFNKPESTQHETVETRSVVDDNTQIN